MAYYNEIDPYAAQWLRNLIAAGFIPAGDVDERSIVDVRADDLRGYIQCHFFAGIGGWPYALRLAGWPDDKPVWTGSCPCQPFSIAGQRQGHVDERHLWPAFYRLIAECRPATIFGEQVASKDGREWFSAVRADLESLGYACGAADLCAAGVGAPHIRQRLWFVADRFGAGLEVERVQPARDQCAAAERGGTPNELADADQGRWGRRTTPSGRQAGHDATGGGSWMECDWLSCTDGKARPVEPGTFPLAHGIPARASKLRAYGNAIVPQVGAEFIAAFMECQ